MTASLTWHVWDLRKRTDVILREFTTDAVILRETAYKENDRILTVLTPERGILTVYARGVRNIASKNSAAVQLFCYSELELICSSSSHLSLKTAVLKDGFFGLRSDIARYALACYMSDAVTSFCTSENDESDAMRLVLNTLYAAANLKDKPLWQIKAAFELKLCCIAGFTPDFSQCAYCSEVLDKADGMAEHGGTYKLPAFNQDTGRYAFSVSEGAPICVNCLNGDIKNSAYTVYVSAPALLAAEYVARAEIPKYLSFKLSAESADGFCDMCEKYLLYHAERGFDTLKYLKTLI